MNAVLASPVELLKIKMQAQYGAGSTVHYSGPVDCARQLIKEHGIRHGLMRGYWITVIREIPGYAGFYAGFEGMKRYLTPVGENPATYPLGLLSLMASGASGGVSYWFACYPLDMLKSMVSLLCVSLSLSQVFSIVINYALPANKLPPISILLPTDPKPEQPT